MKKIAKSTVVIVSCAFAAIMAIGETLGNIKNEERMENFERRLDNLESKKES